MARFITILLGTAFAALGGLGFYLAHKPAGIAFDALVWVLIVIVTFRT